MEADLAVAMGGRVAEEMIFGDGKVTSGASSDIRMATDIAENMVLRWGMSKKLGPINYSDDEQEYFSKQKVSAETRKIIDGEIKDIVEGGHKRAFEILTKYRHELDMLGEALLEYETLSGDEITDLFKGKKPNKPSVRDASKTAEEKIVAIKKSSVPSGGIAKKPKKTEE
jgi:cell division protease FtsH